jgi:hypothetical protein
MTQQLQTKPQMTTDGAPDILPGDTAPVGGDVDLKAAASRDGSTHRSAASAAPQDLPVAPVETFDPPASAGDRRLFQNGDTDRNPDGGE